MLKNVKRISTGEVVYENIDVKDEILGAFDGDDRHFIRLVNGEQIILQPSDDYTVYDQKLDEETTGEEDEDGGGDHQAGHH